jgi:hypothetical protein
MNPNHQQWNVQHKLLQRAIAARNNHQEAISIFLGLHAMVHAGQMSQVGLWSFEDDVWHGLSAEAARTVPKNEDHSIAWLFWHIARIEDVTMNMLVAGSPQVLIRDGWLDKLYITRRDTGNLTDVEAVQALSRVIDLDALRGYRLAVGRRTREIVQALAPGQLKQKVDPVRLQKVLTEGAVIEAANDLIEYWGNKTIGGLLAMPPTRHNFVHLNEALRVKHLSKAND